MLRTIVLALVLLIAPSLALANKRVALVVGNAAYEHAGTLANPVNDAHDLASQLRQLRFRVILGTNLNKQAFDSRLREFARALEGADAGVFFYAGHGLQVRGTNYLVATDAKLEAERDLDFEAQRVDLLLSLMEREAKTNIVFLDACRDNPLARNLARTMGNRSVNENSGLAPVASALGTFIAFATQPGNVASDGTGRNSPFSAALKKHMGARGLSVTDLMIEVRKEVVDATNGRQVPWEHSALKGRFYFNLPPPQPAAPAEATVPPAVRPSEAAEAWAAAKDTQSVAALQAFIKRFGDTYYGDLARERLSKLKPPEEKNEVKETGKRKTLLTPGVASQPHPSKKEPEKSAPPQDVGLCWGDWGRVVPCDSMLSGGRKAY